MLDRYCVECHNDAELTADLSFEGRGSDDVHADPAVWEEVLRKLKIDAMPPREEPQPDDEMRGAVRRRRSRARSTLLRPRIRTPAPRPCIG